ncbi:HAD family hydrolase [Telmatospirillum sp. J64-1]|uniref:HAD family hydrolase n=1 Tax=Telmatospirillum sp. J64-1 TaxID=2502183 RepID=UPI00115D3A0F|nr:HAD family hydrolase [Telmatospirillum sp. J64-1]
MKQPRAVIFDWDNTLVDSWGCIHEALNATMLHMGHPEWSLEETRARVALSLRDHFPILFGDRWMEARDVFYASFAAVHIERLKPLPGAAEMLRGLHEAGLYLAVVSNKNGAFLRREAEHLGWTPYFGRLVGATDAAQDKPSAAPVFMALEGSGIEPGEDVWFLGDAVVDMQCALATGCVPVLMREHRPGEGEFDAYPPKRHVIGCGEFAALVHELSVPISPI